MRIALLNFGGIGDEILFSPVVNHIRQAYPHAHIRLILEQRSQAIAPLLPGLTDVETVTHIHDRKALFWQLLQKLKSGRYDAVVSSGSSPFIALLLWVSGIKTRVGFATGKWTDRLLTHPAPLNTQQYAGAMYTSLAEAWLGRSLSALPMVQPDMVQVNNPLQAWVGQLPAGKKVLIHPGVSALSIQKNILKSWPTESWLSLITQLVQSGRQVIVAGGPDDADTIAQLINGLSSIDKGHHVHVAYGKTRNLHDLAWLLQQADAVVCVDSAPMHLAVALNVPVVALFGPTDPAKLLPQDNHRFQSVTVQNLPCRPCLFDMRKTSCDSPVCLQIPEATVLQAINSKLN